MIVSLFTVPLAVCCFLCLYRIFQGPTAADRIVAIDILGILMVGFCAVISFHLGLSYFLDITIAFALLSFTGTLTLAKYLERRGLDD